MRVDRPRRGRWIRRPFTLTLVEIRRGRHGRPRAKARMASVNCAFCDLIDGRKSCHGVFEDELSMAFLDHRPLFPGHCLLVPRQHYETLADLPAELVAPLFANARLLAIAVERAMQAEGSFVAINNRVSQSVPHLHVHVVPRRRKDGLRGFFWPRQRYESGQAMTETQTAIRAAIAELKTGHEPFQPGIENERA